jgi:multiple antibiotic resistance protein
VNAVESFLLAFPALFSIVNPLGGAFIFNEVTSDVTHADRQRLAGKVGMYAAIVMMVALWGGAYVLNFFGISLGALRIAGGLFVTLRGLEMLAAPERQEARKTEQAGAAAFDMDSMAFFPLTMPFTTGPGTIAVAVALGAERPSSGLGLVPFFVGVTGAALALAVLTWLCYRWADTMANALSASGRKTASRLTAFLLLCIGVQILMTGVEGEISRVMGVG